MPYIHQTQLRFRLSCGDITGATAAVIAFKRPDGTTGNWGSGVIETPKSPAGHVYIDLSSTGQLNQAGEWKIWPRLTFGAKSAPGKADLVIVRTEGE